MKRIISTILIMCSLNVMGSEKGYWPTLSEVKSVSNRIATEEDVNSGAAVFLLKSGEIHIGTPMKIVIPQYAIHTDLDSGEKSDVIIIQAEEADGKKYIGAKVVGQEEYMIGLYEEFKLLGERAPNE